MASVYVYPLTTFAKRSILNAWQGSKCISVIRQADHGIGETNSLGELCTVVLQNNDSRKFLKNNLNKKRTPSSVYLYVNYGIFTNSYFREHHQVTVCEFTRKVVCRLNLPSLWKYY